MTEIETVEILSLIQATLRLHTWMLGVNSIMLLALVGKAFL